MRRGRCWGGGRGVGMGMGMGMGMGVSGFLWGLWRLWGIGGEGGRGGGEFGIWRRVDWDEFRIGDEKGAKVGMGWDGMVGYVVLGR